MWTEETEKRRVRTQNARDDEAFNVADNSHVWNRKSWSLESVVAEVDLRYFSLLEQFEKSEEIASWVSFELLVKFLLGILETYGYNLHKNTEIIFFTKFITKKQKQWNNLITIYLKIQSKFKHFSKIIFFRSQDEYCLEVVPRDTMTKNSDIKVFHLRWGKNRHWVRYVSLR